MWFREKPLDYDHQNGLQFTNLISTNTELIMNKVDLGLTLG